MTICRKNPIFALLLTLLWGVALTGCQKEVVMEDLVTRNGVAYVKGSRIPFTGPIKSYYDEDALDKPIEERRVYQEGIYLNGRKTDKWITYKWDGGRIETPYVNGVKEGVEKTFYNTGEPKREQRFFDGHPNGNDVHFSKDNVRTLQIFYRHGHPGAPPPNRKAEMKMEEEEKAAAKKRDERLFGVRQKSWMEHVMDLF